MDILKLLKQGWSPEDIMEEFDEAMQLALSEYEKYQEEERRKEAERKAQEEQKEYALMKQKEAREALGAAFVNFAIAYGFTDGFEEMDFIALDHCLLNLAHGAKSVSVDHGPSVRIWRA